MATDAKRSGDSVPADALNVGLDRATIHPDGQVQLPKDNANTIAQNGHDNGARQDNSKHVEFAPTKSSSLSSHSMIGSLKERKHEAGAKLRKTLHIHQKSDDGGPNSDSAVLANTVNENSDSRLVSKLPAPEKTTLKDLVHDPVDTVKSKVSGQGNHQVAANIAAKEIPHGQEVDLVKARTAVERARTEKERLLAIQDLSKLMKDRQSTYARWTLDRHVTKVRVIPRDTFVRRPKADFVTKNAREEIVTDWRAYGQHLLLYYAQQYGGQYIGYGSDPLPASKETIMPNIERLIVATAPFQEFIMTTRRVYRWENCAETTKYLLIYLTLWYLNLLFSGILSAILYMVLQRRAHGNTLEDLREDIKHREDVNRTALSLTEFIEKEGDEKWADDLLEGVGPWLMIQLADMANFFESVRNFYEWLVPSQTIVTLAVFAVSILATALVPLQLMVKSMTFGAGFAFFALFPIATNFPDYRLLVSPAKAMLWNIPTHAEWAIKYIQAEGTRYEKEHNTTPLPLPPQKTSSTSPAARDHGFYSAHYNGSAGRLIISTGFTRFESKALGNVHWILPYNQINKIEKVDRIATKNIPDKLQTKSGQDLRFVDNAGEEFLVKNLNRRDEAFSQVVGFSNITWQVLW